MFERYTEAARRIVFYARHEASQSGSVHIQPEHLIPGMLHDEKNILQSLFEPDRVIALEQDIRASFVQKPSLPENVDLPLSRDAMTILSTSAKVAEQLNSPDITPEHILLGVLETPDLPIVRVLERHGLTRDQISVPATSPTVTREALQALIAALPEECLRSAYGALASLHQTPQSASQPFISRLQNYARQRLAPSRIGNFSHSHIEGGDQVTVSRRLFRGHEITMVERLHVQEEAKLLSYTQEIHGPGREHHVELDFDIG